MDLPRPTAAPAATASDPDPVVPRVEKKVNWEEHRDGVLQSLSPVGHLEFVLIAPAHAGSASRRSAIHDPCHIDHPVGDLLGSFEGLRPQ
jgi:hypothetical protein